MSKDNFEYSLSDTDVQAILTAFPLILLADAGSDAQNRLNASCCESAGAKLVRGTQDFTLNELRVIYGAVALAKEYLTGGWDLDVSAKDKAELKKYLFTYIKLETALGRAFESFHI